MICLTASQITMSRGVPSLAESEPASQNHSASRGSPLCMDSHSIFATGLFIVLVSVMWRVGFFKIMPVQDMCRRLDADRH